jgi:hypothetical protein
MLRPYPGQRKLTRRLIAARAPRAARRDAEYRHAIDADSFDIELGYYKGPL